MNNLRDKKKNKNEKFDPGLKKLIFALIIVTVALVVLFGKKASDGISHIEGQTEIQEIEKEYKRGNISLSTARRSVSGVRHDMETVEEALKRQNINFTDYTGLPDWARNLGIPEITGLSLIQEKSIIIESDGERSDSFAAVYAGAKEDLISAGKNIADILELNIVSDTDGSFAAEGAVKGCSVVIGVSDGIYNYQLKYGVSKLK